MLKIDNFIRFIEQYIFLNDLSIKSKGFRGNKQRSETRAISALTQREASSCMKKYMESKGRLNCEKSLILKATWIGGRAMLSKILRFLFF